MSIFLPSPNAVFHRGWRGFGPGLAARRATRRALRAEVEAAEGAEAAAACHLRRTVARDLAALGAVAAEQLARVVSDADEEATARRGRVRTSRGFAGKMP